MHQVRRFLKAVRALLSKVIALPIAVGYGTILFLRNWLYDRGWLPVHSLPCTVISVGNLTLGGSGKTPFALYLLQWLKAHGIAAAYLSRGYKRKTKGYMEVQLSATKPVYLYGDEPYLVKRRFPDLPVAVCEDRVAGGKALLQSYPHLQVLVLDDAFQHRRIHRDLDILIVDMERPIWKDWLFPLGQLREPLRSYHRAHLLILNQKTVGQTSRRRFQKPSLYFSYEAMGLLPARSDLEPLPLKALQYRSVLAFCGIAHPDSFYHTLKKAGAYIVQNFDFPDHYLYREKDLAHIRSEFRRYQRGLGIPDILLLTTEKDLIRLEGAGLLPALEGLPLYAVQIAMKPLRPEESERFLRSFFTKYLIHDHA